jgi:hypothetical protein
VRPVLFLFVAAGFLIAPREARPCGPGVHARDAASVLDLLAASDASWAAIKTDPVARSWLVAGSLAPDLQWWLSLPYGHESALSYALMDLAPAKGASFEALALGHLAHVTASDPSCEDFWAPALFESAPIGMVDLFASDENAEGAASTFVSESYGDVILGDWDALVDALYDLYLDGPGAKAMLSEAMGWYCEVGRDLVAPATDCDTAVQDLMSLMSLTDAGLGAATRDDAKGMMRDMRSLPLPDLADVVAQGALGTLLGTSTVKSVWYDDEMTRLKTGPLADPAFWARYDTMFAAIAPRWALARMEARNDSWPSWDPPAHVSANVVSMMRFLPDEYSPRTGLLVDAVEWRDPAGVAIDAVTTATAGRMQTVVIRFYSAVPYRGTLRGVVRKDMPGADATGDAIVGDATMDVDIDPLGYVTTPRSELAIPFVADTSGALGLYFELYCDGDARPCFTSSWDRLWLIGALPLDHAVYRDNFGTYGHFPPSLPAAIEQAEGPDATAGGDEVATGRAGGCAMGGAGGAGSPVVLATVLVIGLALRRMTGYGLSRARAGSMPPSGR